MLILFFRHTILNVFFIFLFQVNAPTRHFRYYYYYFKLSTRWVHFTGITRYTSQDKDIFLNMHHWKQQKLSRCDPARRIVSRARVKYSTHHISIQKVLENLRVQNADEKIRIIIVAIVMRIETLRGRKLNSYVVFNGKLGNGRHDWHEPCIIEQNVDSAGRGMCESLIALVQCSFN